MPANDPAQGLTETAGCYNKLLQMIIKTDMEKPPSAAIRTDNKRETLSAAVVISIMDFLYCAYEVYDEYTRLPPELSDELRSIVESLDLTGESALRFVADKLVPVFSLQRRLKAFENIFRHFRPDDEQNLFTVSGKEMVKLDKEFAKVTLNFSDDHLRWNKLVDNFGRNLIHIVALEGMDTNLWWMLDNLREEDRKSALLTAGLDGMTPLHLVSRSGSLDCLRSMKDGLGFSVTEIYSSLAKKDIWGRAALHVAVRFGHDDIIVELLEMGARSDTLDDNGQSPVDYFLERRRRRYDHSVGRTEDKHDSTAEENSSNDGQTDSEPLSKTDLKLFLKMAMREPNCRYGNGKTFLHMAVTAVNTESIDGLLQKGFKIDARDKDERTPLHYALLTGRTDMAMALINGFGDYHADPTARDIRNMTTLMFAIRGTPKRRAEKLKMGSVQEQEADNTSNVDQDIFDFLITNDLGNSSLAATDSNGKTALRHALTNSNEAVALYLLQLDQLQENPFDNDNESLLVAACRTGCSAVVSKIVERWPGITNKADSTFDRPPISWACLNGYDETVKQLLAYDGDNRVDVNQCDKWEFTPLHFAADQEEVKCLQHLLGDKSAKLDSKNNGGRTPLELAFKQKKTDIARLLLLDDRTSDLKRIYYARKFTSSSSDEFSELVLEVLELRDDGSLCNEYLLCLVNDVVASGISSATETFMTGTLGKGARKQPQNPYHRAVLLGKPELVTMLKEQNVDQTGLDRDNWSWVDYAARFDRNGAIEFPVSDEDKVSHTTSDYAVPTALVWELFRENIQVTPCNIDGHKECTGVHDVRVTGEHRSVTYICVGSNHCIAPPTERTKDLFYFEIEVLQESSTRNLGIGFCGKDTGNDQMPGWFLKSWAYHGDDGNLFIEYDEEGFVPSEHFGDNGTFGAGQVVGACMNVQTGQGFCTRDGARLDMGELPTQV
ncbi:hypothetical protein QQX98_005671 [Neonectria punicea]|uniref:Protein SSH4 n=1 Tax=Neonectria punicea TaxID=979145 RepID=A0ABR1H4B7_9HYPO